VFVGHLHVWLGGKIEYIDFNFHSCLTPAFELLCFSNSLMNLLLIGESSGTK